MDMIQTSGPAHDKGAQHSLSARPVKMAARNVRLDYYNERIGQTLKVLDGIDLSVFSGELLSIVGPSGCGKSTFLSAVDGLISIDDGQILVDDQLITKPGPDRAMVFQNDSLFPWRTVTQNVMYGLEIQQKMPRGQMLDRARSLVELVGLSGFGDHFPHELSGGMRQRVNIARALAPDPQLLLLDEPFAALDAQTREFMQAELLKILERTQKTALFITHQIDEAIFLSSRVAVFSGRPARIKEVVTIDLPQQRTLSIKQDPRFRHLQDHIWRLIEEESAKTGMQTHA
jgi:NitT/TauT family transport system ATP-binding protein